MLELPWKYLSVFKRNNTKEHISRQTAAQMSRQVSIPSAFAQLDAGEMD